MKNDSFSGGGMVWCDIGGLRRVVFAQFINLPVIQFSDVYLINKLMWLPFVATYYYFMNRFYARRLGIYKEKYRNIKIIWQKTFGVIFFIILPFPIAILLLTIW